MRLLSAEWIAERLRLGSALPEAPGATALVQHVVEEGPDGTVEYYDDIRDGRLADSALGRHPTPHAVINYRWPVELAMLRGELDPVGGVLSGRILIDGDMNSLLPLVPVLRTSAAIDVQRALDGLLDPS
ncbi:hypothetical protein FKN01_13395 [Streptomyces sp. 130]|uniref:SCP2 sterol-binding domain-containing protein n=1 Tax=Streptomyces sp. 130 TaxID=2591006 RepID=UPI00117ED008|nr:hypothetical protein [Streptomyces sp. 130]TRV78295.1 hypothetical protein FKN01_13395 [Streptomyces sp. 130]